MKRILPNILLIIGLVSMLTGCETVDYTLSDVGGAAAGGALGYELSNGGRIASIAGAAGGVGLSKISKMRVEKCLKESYQNGYDDAMRQNVKQQYWITQNRQKEDIYSSRNTTELVPVTIDEQEIDGEMINERIEYVRVERI